mmetsp:Transcript_26435/g.67206  ORF Transcript_26435/g.67206 Transcript_26435/m.67206 type:complete len:208 (-) Transcript_26435:136-759(-)
MLRRPPPLHAAEVKLLNLAPPAARVHEGALHVLGGPHGAQQLVPWEPLVARTPPPLKEPQRKGVEDLAVNLIVERRVPLCAGRVARLEEPPHLCGGVSLIPVPTLSVAECPRGAPNLPLPRRVGGAPLPVAVEERDKHVVGRHAQVPVDMKRILVRGALWYARVVKGPHLHRHVWRVPEISPRVCPGVHQQPVPRNVGRALDPRLVF